MNNKLAMFGGFTLEIPILERLTLIKQAGFGATMLDYNDDDIEVKVDEQVAHCKKIGLDICCAHLRYNDGNAIWWDDNWAELIIHDITSCHKNGISIVVLHLTQGGNYPPVNNEGIKRLENIANHCKKLGITFALENKRGSNHIEEVFKVIDNDALAFCYDIGHEGIYMNQGDVVNQLSPYYPLSILHMHDNHHTADEHMLPMDGDIDYQAVIKQLREHHYNGYILLECRKEFARMYDNMTNEQFLQRGLEKAQYLYDNIIGKQH